MRLSQRAFALAAFAGSFAASRAAQHPKETSPNPICAKTLSVAAVERISGRQNVTLVPKQSVTGAGGTCNYAIDKKMLVLMTIMKSKSGGSDQYAVYKRSSPYQDHQKDIPGLGDAAFSSGPYDNIVVTKKGLTVVLVSSFYDYDRASHKLRGTYLTGGQLVQLAREALGNL